MSDEAAFLDALKANPADDLTRLVYADWLDEHDRPAMAEFLRLTCSFVSEDEAELPVERIGELGGRIPEEWRVTVAGRFDFVMHDYGAGGKLGMIKAARELTGFGLGELKGLVELPPWRIFGWLPLDTALGCYSRVMERAPGADVRIVPSDPREPPTSFRLQASYWVWNQNARHDPLTWQRARDAFAAFLEAAKEPADEISEDADSRLSLLSAPLHATAFIRRLREARRLAAQHAQTDSGWDIFVSGHAST